MNREELKKQYEDEIASQKAKKEAQQKAMLDEQIQKKRKQKEDEVAIVNRNHTKFWLHVKSSQQNRKTRLKSHS